MQFQRGLLHRQMRLAQRRALADNDAVDAVVALSNISEPSSACSASRLWGMAVTEAVSGDGKLTGAKAFMR